jgi:hypothetical protein
MATEMNPYAAPRSDVNAGGGRASPQGMFWRVGALLVARHGAVLPPRCVKCNEAADGQAKKQRFYWHHQAWFLLILVNIILYIVVVVFVRRHADVTLGLCQDHRRKRAQGILVTLAGIGSAVVLFAFGIVAAQPIMVVASLLVLLVAIVVGIVKTRVLFPVRIDQGGAQLKGCCEAFLAGLPNP